MFSKFISLKKILEYSAEKYLKTTLRNGSFSTVSAKTSIDHRYMIVDINKNENASNSEQLKYPLIWLRDNCQCSNCFHAQTKSRIIDWTKFNFENALPKSITVSYSIYKCHTKKKSFHFLHTCLANEFYYSILKWKSNEFNEIHLMDLEK